MAARSPSPNPSQPKSREISSSLRKSKEIPQRSSLSKPSLSSPRASFEQKENVRTRSPAVFSIKGSKNFMAPTISAVSKAVAASPRKKILQERNEVINSSSDSFEFLMKDVGVGVEIQKIGSKLEMGFGSREVLCCGELKKGGSGIKNHHKVVGFEEVGSKSEMGFGSREVLGSGELRKGEPRIKNHQNVIVPSVSVSPLPFIAPLDADPSLPPYDPKTNFLSPRIQFLHYRPNPRMHYLNGEGEFHDIENGRRLEDTFSSESSEDDDTTVLTEEKEKESEEESFHSEVEEVKEVESPSKTLVSEPEFKPEPLKRRPFRRSKLIPYLLLLVVACLYAPLSDSPIISSSMLKDQSFPKFYTPSFEVFEDLRLRDYLAVETDKIELVVPEDLKEAEVGAQGIEMSVSEDVIDADTVGYKMGKVVTEDEGRNELEQEASPINYEAAHIKEEVNAEIVPESEIIGDEGDSSDVDVIDHAQSASSIDSQSEFREEYQISHGLELTKSLNYATLFGLSLALLLLPATMVFLYMKQKKAPMVEKERQIIKKVGSVSGSGETYILGKGFPCQNLPGNEEMIGDAGPEMSSSWSDTSSSSRHLATRDNEEQDLSNERRLRRYSTASSISYGSFTTYERLSAKKRFGDEEVVTPVRRSSRIRNLVTSP